MGSGLGGGSRVGGRLELLAIIAATAVVTVVTIVFVGSAYSADGPARATNLSPSKCLKPATFKKNKAACRKTLLKPCKKQSFRSSNAKICHKILSKLEGKGDTGPVQDAPDGEGGGLGLYAPWPAGVTLTAGPSFYHQGAHFDYGGKWGDDSYAVDFGTRETNDFRLPILAAHAGTVQVSNFNSAYGNQVVIESGGCGYATRYAHLDARSVGVGQFVNAGDQIGLLGHSGTGGGSLSNAHLHFAAYANCSAHSGTPPSPMAGVNLCNGCRVTSTTQKGGAGDPPPPPILGTGTWNLRNALTDGPAEASFQFASPGDIPVAGDWNGDGIDTPGVFRPSDGTWYFRNSNSGGGADFSFGFASPGDLPVVGDWNGDGIDTPGVFRAKTGQWYLRNSQSTGAAEVSFGFASPGDLPVAGDWNGDGIDSVGVFRPQTGTWFLKNGFTTGTVDASFGFASPGDKVVAGDWNGDGADSVGVFRPSNATWFLKNALSGGAPDNVFHFANGTDYAVAGDWNGDGADSAGATR